MENKKILVFGSDHAGINLKRTLMDFFHPEFEILDVGTKETSSCDYPVYARNLCVKVLEHQTLGILICGTGIGMSITANRFKGIRAALCINEYMAIKAREHNDANVLCLGERVVGVDLAKHIASAFIKTKFAGERHLKRIELIEKLI
ncbi:ribose 5-phosphate isomerase B [Desulfonauticus submarinus]|uniref:Ribose-5-phosphate isomerase n=1 Tax=Desulfonauticus submarinus TaxID=206665 RepID=A0A1H0CHX6_9BACT|nr:ribose 5-phosphate isomerase B [Desulfonauticus submarinus]SDN57518.1 ribose-5-phosphate isomerase [Desulfonauticus submarinus]